MPTLKQLRVKKYLSQKDLADKSGIAEMTINRLELGRNKPNDITLQRLADALGVDPKDIEFPADK